MSGRPAALALAASLVAAPALAAAPTAGSLHPELAVEAVPVLGTGAQIAFGWNEVLVRVQNNGGKPARGRVEVSAQQFGRGEAHEFRATAPFSVGEGAAVQVRVPAQVSLYGDLVVDVFTEAGEAVAQARFPSFQPASVALFDLTEGSRLRGAVNEAAIVPTFTPSGFGSRGTSPPTLSVASPRLDPATGDPMLPDRAALYTTVDVVLVRSDTLARLAGAELDALAGFVLSGGTLAVAVARPEDVRHPTLAAFAGGAISRQGVSAVTLRELLLPSPSSTSSSPKLIPAARDPSGDLAEALVGWTGGNLHGSPYGSSASYGLGEVHLLAFDPTRKPAVDDPWAQARVVDLARRAFDRRSTQVFRPGAEQVSPSHGRVRQQLDPNESSRWSIAAAAILLCVYAVVAGPINFAMATRAGKPLRALRWLPLIAAAAFACVVAIGAAAKGVTGRSRHLTLVEAGAGMPKGSARRWRGFFASRAKDLTVRTTDASSVVSSAVLPETSDRKDHIVVDREGARLVDVTALPWQTIVVREDGFASLGDGIALVKDGEDHIAVVNRSGKDLRAAMLRVPGPRPITSYFPRIKDGERVSSASAKRVSSLTDGSSWEGQMTTGYRAGALSVHHLVAHAMKPFLEPDAPGLADAWRALEDAAGETVDWFPDQVPVLIGQLDGGEGRTHDSGLRTDSDRLLVHIVGLGGRP
jgi:hypothetical protein